MLSNLPYVAQCSNSKIYKLLKYNYLMRIKLKKGKQKELILLAKGNSSWNELAKKLKINSHYLSIELKNEKRLLSEEIYYSLCRIMNLNFDKYIEDNLLDNWGQSKGGNNSEGSTIKLNLPSYSNELAELVGAILGDGNILAYKKGKKIGVYNVNISGDLEKDKDYHINYLKNKFKRVFNLEAKEILPKTHNERFLAVYSKELVEFLGTFGLMPGDKIKNQSTIPKWIFNDENYLKSCLRGLIDTDGSIFRMSNKDFRLMRISFTNYNKKLLMDTRDSFILLGFHPSKVISDKQFFISRKTDISKYLKDIGFSNKKHIDRLNDFNSLVV